jgi:hypothetical protein
MVLIVTDALAISTSTSKISPSELRSLMFGMFTSKMKNATLTQSNNNATHHGHAALSPHFTRTSTGYERSFKCQWLRNTCLNTTLAITKQCENKQNPINKLYSILS